MVIFIPAILAPFPDIAVHVIQAERICRERTGLNRLASAALAAFRKLRLRYW